MTGIFIGLPPHPGTLVAGFVLGVMLPWRRRWRIRVVRSWCLKTNMGWPLDGLPPWTGWRTFSPVRFWAHRGLRLGPVGLPLQRLCVYRGRMVGRAIARAISFVSGREAHTGNPPDDGMLQSGADGWFGGPWAQRLLVPDHFFRRAAPQGKRSCGNCTFGGARGIRVSRATGAVVGAVGCRGAPIRARRDCVTTGTPGLRRGWGPTRNRCA